MSDYDFDDLVILEMIGGEEAMSGGWGGFGGSGGYGGMGGAIVSNDKMFKTFVKPFINVYKTAASGSEAMLQHSKAVVLSLAKAITSAIVPGYVAKFDGIFDRLNKNIDRIRAEHAPVYRDVMSSMRNNEDFIVSALMFDPSSFFKTALQNPQTFVSVWGGNQAIKNFTKLASAIGGDEVRAALPEIKNRLATAKSQGKNVAEVAFSALAAPAFVKSIFNSPTAKEIRAATRTAVNGTAKSVLDEVETAMLVNDIDSLESAAGTKIDRAKLNRLKDEERATVESTIIDGYKQTVKKIAVDKLSAEAKNLTEKGIPENNGIVQTLNQTADKIKEM